ncbi:DUF3620 domain containing protein [Sulfitobacter guttiformis KCTC 32187]|nr:DUF3620 domain containing protein [Sulfitobacter guttiformis KCTC 32187]
MRIHGRNYGARVVGTNALYAYEALAGVRFEEAMAATGDIDTLLDDRNRMRLIADTKEALGVSPGSFSKRRIRHSGPMAPMTSGSLMIADIWSSSSGRCQGH